MVRGGAEPAVARLGSGLNHATPLSRGGGTGSVWNKEEDKCPFWFRMDLTPCKA